MARLVVTSDTHLNFPDLPEGDIFLHCGDFTYMGFRAKKAEVAVNDFWLKSQSHKFKHMVGVAGNHDWNFYKSTFESLALLFDEEIDLCGLRIYGTPYVPTFGNWAFMESEEALLERYSMIPEGLDVLITHGPPYGVLDVNRHGNHCGSEVLLKVLDQMEQPPRYHFFGHIHPHNQPTHMFRSEINHYNVALVNEDYAPENKILVLDI